MDLCLGWQVTVWGSRPKQTNGKLRKRRGRRMRSWTALPQRWRRVAAALLSLWQTHTRSCSSKLNCLYERHHGCLYMQRLPGMIHHIGGGWKSPPVRNTAALKVFVCGGVCTRTCTGLIIFLPFLKGKFILKLLQAQSYKVINVWYIRNMACPERVFGVLFWLIL